MRVRKIVAVAMVVAAVLGGGLLVVKERWPVSKQPSLPDLVPVPDLQAVTRSSTIIAPIVVARSAIRNALEAQAPRQLTGQQVNPLPQFLTAAEVNWSVDRGPLSVTAQEDELTISTELNGRVHIAGAISEITDDLVGTLGGLLNPGLGQALRQLTGQVIDQTVEFRGNVRVISRPSITADWRLRTKSDGHSVDIGGVLVDRWRPA